MIRYQITYQTGAHPGPIHTSPKAAIAHRERCERSAREGGDTQAIGIEVIADTEPERSVGRRALAQAERA